MWLKSFKCVLLVQLISMQFSQLYLITLLGKTFSLHIHLHCLTSHLACCYHNRYAHALMLFCFSFYSFFIILKSNMLAYTPSPLFFLSLSSLKKKKVGCVRNIFAMGKLLWNINVRIYYFSKTNLSTWLCMITCSLL